MTNARYALRIEYADSTIEDAFHHIATKREAIRITKHLATKTWHPDDAVAIWVDDTKTDLGVFKALIAR